MGPRSSNNPVAEFDRSHLIRFTRGRSLQYIFYRIEGLAQDHNIERRVLGVAIDWDNTCQPLVRRKPWWSKKRHRRAKLVIPEETIEFIKNCQAAGLLVAIATNSMGSFEGILKELYRRGVRNEVIVVQPGPGKKPKKPELAYFDMVAARMDLIPSQIVMIGDKYNHDCIPALETGMYAVYVPPLGKDLLAEVFVRRRSRDYKKLKAHGHA